MTRRLVSLCVMAIGILGLAASGAPAVASGPDDALVWPAPHKMHCHMAGEHAVDADAGL